MTQQCVCLPVFLSSSLELLNIFGKKNKQNVNFQTQEIIINIDPIDGNAIMTQMKSFSISS